MAEEVRDKGRSFIVFPEGKWGKNKNTLQEFHDGCFYSAMIAKCPIVATIPDQRAIDQLIAPLDLNAAVPLDCLAYKFDIVLRGRRSTLFENRLEGN